MACHHEYDHDDHDHHHHHHHPHHDHDRECGCVWQQWLGEKTKSNTGLMSDNGRLGKNDYDEDYHHHYYDDDIGDHNDGDDIQAGM